MTNIINKYNLYINSNQRIRGDPNNFVIGLQKPIIRTNERSRFQFFISALNYPFSFSQINDSNNTFNIQLNNNAPVTVTITNGNYNILNLLTEVVSKINIALGQSFNITTNYSKITNKCTINYNTNNINTFLFSFANNTIGAMLGFTSNVTLSYNNSIVSSQPVNVNPVSFFCIRSNSLTIGTNDLESLENSSDKSNIIAKIPITTPSNTYIKYSQPYESRVWANMDIITELDFIITAGGKNRPIGNTIDFSFTLIIEEVLIVEHEGFTTLQDFTNYTQQKELMTQLYNQRQQLIADLMNDKKALEN